MPPYYATVRLDLRNLNSHLLALKLKTGTPWLLLPWGTFNASYGFVHIFVVG